MNRRDEFLKTQKVLRFTTIGSNKTPHIVPVWYMYSSKKIYIGTNTRTQKARNVKKNNKVAFCVDGKTNCKKNTSKIFQKHTKQIGNRITR